MSETKEGKKEFKFTPVGMLGETISVQKMEGGEDTYLRLTKLYRTKAGEMAPTTKGISIPVEFIPALRELIDSSEFISVLESKKD